MKKNLNADSDRIKKAFELSIEEIEDVPERQKIITDVTLMAANAVSNYSRIKSTEIYDKALELMMARKDMKEIPLKE